MHDGAVLITGAARRIGAAIANMAGIALIAGYVRQAAEESARMALAHKGLEHRLKRVRFSETPRAGASFSGDTLSIGIAPVLGAPPAEMPALPADLAQIVEGSRTEVAKQ